MPGLVLVAPVLVAAYSCSKVLTDLGASVLATSVIGAAALLVLATLARSFGRRVERRLWEEWGGPPSRQWVKDKEATFSEDMKRTLREASERLTGITFPSVHETKAQPEEANRKIDDIFLQVRHVLRKKKVKGLWATHNADYGFARNLYGSLIPLAVLAAIASWICVGCFWAFQSTAALVGTIANASISVAALVPRGMLRRHVRDCANRYAESAWVAFLDIDRERAGDVSGERQPAEGSSSSHV